MSRRPTERHNAEFIELWRESGLNQPEVAKLLGVSLAAVKSWCVDEDANFFVPCPKWRVDVFKIALGRKLTYLSAKQREQVLEIFRSVSGRG